jgi:hypothetical protein
MKNFLIFPLKIKIQLKITRDEESIDDSDIQEPTLPPPNESTDLTAYVPFRSSDSHDTSCSDSEGDNLVGSSSPE